MKKRIAILGAGPSGLAQLRAFAAMRDQGHEIPDIVCYEKQADWGGLWRYNWETGLDRHGEPVHGSMYRYLWSNGPKEGLEFADYSFDQHFGQPMPSYLPRAVLKDYIVGRVEKNNIRQYIRFNTAVRWVDYSEETDTFTVTVMDHSKDELVTETFDYVVVATGHFSTPSYPEVAGLDRFPGRVMHAHDFRDAQEFKGKRLLLIGSSYSAEDIGSQCYKYGAESIVYSYRSQPLGFDWPKGFEERPQLSRMHGHTAHFIDGSSTEVDAIVFCTGYQFSFPFLPDHLRLQTENCLYPKKLYKGIFYQSQPKLMYLGMQDQYFTFNMFDTQAWYARDVMCGRLPLPDVETRQADEDAWVAKYAATSTDDEHIDFQAAYIKDLWEKTDYPEFHVEAQGELFKTWLRDKQADIMGFRNRCYRSTVTGTMAHALPKPWLEIMDDSLASFMAQDFVPPAKKSA